MNKPARRSFWAIGILLLAAGATAQYRDDYDADQYGEEYGEISQTVARISYIDGSAAFARGDDPENWQTADRNVPMTIGDRIYVEDRSRVELQIEGGAYIRLGARTDLGALNLTGDTRQFSLNSGVASFQIGRLYDYDVFEVDTPSAAVTLESRGQYRVDVDRDGNTHVSVWRGRATVAAGGGQVPLSSGEAMTIEGLDSPRYDVVALAEPDRWDRWVDQRAARVSRARSRQYVSEYVVGVDDLDEYGQWHRIPEHGWAWSPASVSSDWAPYRAGHWMWQDPWGWTWVSAEPWGWAPYHYGRWVVASSRWCWVPVAPRVHRVAYAPALVAFVGGGSGWSASVRIGGGGFVGWFPLAPRDPFNPWWERRRSTQVHVTNVTYINRTYVTVVNHNTFVSGNLVGRNVVNDRSVLTQVRSAQVFRGPIPVLPTEGSLRASARASSPVVERPPAVIRSRAVVARVAPPPAPPRFQEKLSVIRENRGAPVAPQAAARMAVRDRGRAQTVTQVRPVAAEPGNVTLAPRRGRANAPAAQPVAPSRGRPMSTVERPVADAPVTSRSRGVAADVRSRERAAPVTTPGRPEAREPEAIERQREQEQRRIQQRRRDEVPPTPEPDNEIERRRVQRDTEAREQEQRRIERESEQEQRRIQQRRRDEVPPTPEPDNEIERRRVQRDTEAREQEQRQIQQRQQEQRQIQQREQEQRQIQQRQREAPDPRREAEAQRQRERRETEPVAPAPGPARARERAPAPAQTAAPARARERAAPPPTETATPAQRGRSRATTEDERRREAEDRQKEKDKRERTPRPDRDQT